MLLSSGERVTSTLLSIALNEMGFKSYFYSEDKLELLQIMLIQKLELKLLIQLV